MKTPNEDSRQVVDRFLGKLGEPLLPLQVERALARVHSRLDDAEALSISASTPRATVSFRWSTVAAAVLVMLAGGLLQMLFLRPGTDGNVAKAVSGGQVYFAESYRPIPIASRIEGGQLVRAGLEGGAIALLDGSRVEMSPRAELSIVHASDGMQVRLGSGTVIVTAAKQRHGHLYVETKDLLVSVVGTVFSVSAEAVGSRVSVIEGEVHVQQGQIVHTLLPGQQASTSPALEPLSVQTELQWSKNAPELMALLQQSVQQTPPPPLAQGNVLQGTVRQMSTQEGIANATLSLCPLDAASDARSLPQVGRLPSRAGISEIRITNSGLGAASIEVATPDGNRAFQSFAFNTCRNPLSTTTDATGRFLLRDVPSGTYTARAERDGYWGTPNNGAYPAFASQSLTIDSQQAPPEITLSMVRGGSISGRVRDAEGKLAVGATVQTGVSVPGEALPRLNMMGSKGTDDRGEYRLFSLPPGEYYVSAGGPGTPAGRVLRVWTGFTPSTLLPTPGQTYFPNGTSVSEATRVVLREGEDVAGIDIVLRPSLPSDAPVLPPGLQDGRTFRK